MTPALIPGEPANNYNTVTDESASRVLGTQYQNTTGRPLLMTVIVNAVAAGGYIGIYMGVASANLLVTKYWNPTGGAATAYTTVIVPRDLYYKAAAFGGGAPSLAYWFEFTQT